MQVPYLFALLNYEIRKRTFERFILISERLADLSKLDTSPVICIFIHEQATPLLKSMRNDRVGVTEQWLKTPLTNNGCGSK
ncbi:hypothetical protein CEXT_622041 [Caerostris extrusa]|uniref:Uncharacterized protein n=1 Tax=Caerostris extrusa TaxID=172846 RepID=A0AAV4YA40_CAEEX|nr:hypothetical protein CEXT_622041 [Caerostris extrusa]